MWWGGRGGHGDGGDGGSGNGNSAQHSSIESEYARLAAQAEVQWKQDVTSQLKDISGKVMELALTMQSLSASMMTRKEIEDADNKRVAVDTYAADMKAVADRLARLEGSAARVLPWVALGISSVIGIIGTAISVVSLVHGLTR